MNATLTAADPVTAELLCHSTFRRWTLAEYHKMIDDGILMDGEPYELLDGHMVLKMSRGVRHDGGMDVLEGLLLALLPAAWFIRSQKAVTLVNDSEPEPDFAVVRGPRTRYRQAHPGPADIGLVIETSDSSLRLDSTVKARIYARAGIPAYWVVDVAGQTIAVFTDPSGDVEQPAYASRTSYPVGSAVPVVLDGVTVGTVAVADVFAA